MPVLFLRLINSSLAPKNAYADPFAVQSNINSLNIF